MCINPFKLIFYVFTEDSNLEPNDLSIGKMPNLDYFALCDQTSVFLTFYLPYFKNNLT